MKNIAITFDNRSRMFLLDMLAAHFAERLLSNIWLTDAEIDEILSKVRHKVKIGRNTKVY